jgi:hypothetical protein
MAVRGFTLLEYRSVIGLGIQQIQMKDVSISNCQSVPDECGEP